ncbi:MAG: RagB/SusD family nutrient uptake outer membrane protein, partial [Bacteroidales bacterium]|nr:RagB/SusD family nutrient uptake outer membrane protein [Bacteroidales bacterium]
SCEDVLDRAPLDKISEKDIWNNEVMVKAYVTNLYSRIPFNDALLSYGDWYKWCDEGTTAIGNFNNIAQGTVSKTSEGNAYWDYAYIRDCNVFLEKMITSAVNQSVKTQLEGEVRFMRAFAYFEMMKRYGGVPLVDAVIDPFKPIDDKYQVRATEEAIANFINTELTTAVSLLSDVATAKERINKWTAYALNARAMLWAASIAKYGTVQLNGLVGISASQANAFYTKASAAADAVINSGKYSLYNATPANKSENYRNIFLVENNSEVIFEKPYDGVNVAHSWDAWCAPDQWVGRGSLCDPTLEFILGYENIDGSATQPTFGAGKLYTDGYEPFANKDPRLRATVFFQGETFPNGTIDTYEGIDPSPTPTPATIISSSSTAYNGKASVGLDSRMVPKDDMSTNSGFICKKYIITTQKNIAEFNSYTNWIAIRLAEMYLTKAEAEFEMGNIAPAVTALNMTRNRAGISLVDAASITRDKIRTERRSELAYECHRYWDLRRWRTAISVLNVRLQGLRIIYHDASGKYYFLPFNCETFTRAYKQEHYYNPITTGRIDNNPKLVENPLY